MSKNVVRKPIRVTPKKPTITTSPKKTEKPVEKVSISTDRPEPPAVFDFKYDLDLNNLTTQYTNFMKEYVQVLTRTCLSQFAMEAATKVVVNNMNAVMSNGIGESEALIPTIESVHDTATSLILMECALIASGYSKEQARMFSQELLLKEQDKPSRGRGASSMPATVGNKEGSEDLRGIKNQIKELIDGVGIRVARRDTEKDSTPTARQRKQR